jgi:predicted 3-demethylubiquinone-9 3-methyltransferase (glyoxalase superfamily)
MQRVRPFLWFDDAAEDAAKLYTSVFGNSKITNVVRYSEESPGPAGKVMLVSFELDGQEFMALNFFGGNPDFDRARPSPAFYVNCETQEEVDHFWERLSEGGEKGVCGWLKDRFGVNWNVVPTILGELMQDEDEERSTRVMKAMLGMTKIEIEGLKQAYEG